ncbi:hypothetical protein OPV22_018418 [Ensete ventricosum]|uniref:Carbohydrate binding domain-containing protein n=1 Tax=Ensete ventricosum TaxID=4639 RepID=A0AAV8QYL7_ENSVE|nr:hypothetical protein OPV22_018418 [Ensete ventricosum]
MVPLSAALMPPMTSPTKETTTNKHSPRPTTNAPMLGVLARLHGGHSGCNQLLPVVLPIPGLPVKNKDGNHIPHPQPSTPLTALSPPFTIEQKATTSWESQGKDLLQSGNDNTFPTWLDSLPAGKSFEFVYIHSASPADILVSGYTLV